MATISNRPITPAQVRAIHVALSRRGIDDDTYRGILRERFDAGTCKTLTRRQASDLLAALGRALPRPPGTRGPRPRPRRQAAAPNVRRMVSPAQRQLIGRLAAEVVWRTADGYSRWLRDNQGLERVSTSEQAARVIEGLKAIQRRRGAPRCAVSQK